MMAPFNLQKWIVGGTNAPKDYHYNEGEELFYQIEGDITVRIQDDGKGKDIVIKEGGEVKVVNLVDGFSTTSILDKLKK